MASNINFISIDESYPVAGRDNDSQGFRDNFSIIKNNFNTAKGEIEDLQLNTARLDENNNFNSNTISNVSLTNFSQGIYNGGTTVSSVVLLEYKNGPYQLFTVGSNLQFTIRDWPLEKYGKITIHLLGDGTVRTVSFVGTGGTIFKKAANVPETITISSATNPTIMELWTVDSGLTVYINNLGLFT